jgi:hypothetical protein
VIFSSIYIIMPVSNRIVYSSIDSEISAAFQ